ncbi:protein kinase [Actinokineospora sp. PR83]|uniref:protein kinase domain-containing protein n=1 Tax=Actinokineospora sp. PR83 TaxID=2884908 RepID=UPI001F440466|nr:protein kinase [Actinokineospora sp. PR83]MCG8920179.1 protein kinase [Actinokineospora sp. PR83]
MVHDEVTRYRLVRLLGRGGMGEVHVAEDTMLHNRQVALKLLSAGALTDPDLERRFRQECELAAQIDHPNVLPVYNYSVGEKPYIAMRYVDGTDLSSEIKAHPGGLDPERAVHVVSQVAAALDAAHRKHLRHRDVKPSNILLERVSTAGGEHAWLFDWGIAQPIEAQPLTGLNQIVGTPHYIAPERLDGTRSDHRADVYALAVVLYECLSGRRPFAGDDMSVLVAHMQTPPPPLPDSIGDGLRAVVAKGLAKKPDERYQSAGDLAAAARDALREEQLSRLRASLAGELAAGKPKRGRSTTPQKRLPVWPRGRGAGTPERSAPAGPDGRTPAGSEGRQPGGQERGTPAGPQGRVPTGSEGWPPAGPEGRTPAGSESRPPADPEGRGLAGPQGRAPAGPEGQGLAGAGGRAPAGPGGQGLAGADGRVPAGPEGQVAAGLDGQGPAGPEGRVPAGPEGQVAAGLDGQGPAGPEGRVPVGSESWPPAGPGGRVAAGLDGQGPAGADGRMGAEPGGRVPAGPEGWTPAGSEGWSPAGPEGREPAGSEGWPPAGPEGRESAGSETWTPGGSERRESAGSEAWAPAGPEGRVPAGSEGWESADSEGAPARAGWRESLGSETWLFGGSGERVAAGGRAVEPGARGPGGSATGGAGGRLAGVRVPEVVAGGAVGGIVGGALVFIGVAGVWILFALVVAGALLAFGVRGPAAPPGPARPDDHTRDAGGLPPPRS